MSLSAGLHARQCSALQCSYQPQHRCFRSPQPCVRLVSPARRDLKAHAQGNFGTQIIGGGLGGSNEIFVAGADGQLGARIIQKLLQAGYKVAAGVSDQEQAQTVVDFASSVELLKKQEVQKLRLAELNLADTDSIQSVLPRGARVVVVVSDSAVKGAAKVDGRATSRILQAAQENDASQFVLVTPGGSGGGGFFGALFGTPSVGGSGRKPSKIEQEIASSGLDFVVVRTGKTDGQSSDFDETNNVALGEQGSLPPKPVISKAQVADVVQQILRQADSDVLIEAWASSQNPAISIEEAVAQALPAATIEEEEEEEAEEEPSPVEAVQEVVEEAEVPEAVEKPAKSFFGGFGTRKLKTKPSAEEEESEEAAAPAPPAPKRRPTPPPRKQRPSASAESDVSDNGSSTQRVGLFGFGKKKAAADDDEEEDATPTKTQRQRGFRGFGKKASQENEEEEPAKPQRGGFLGLGKKAPEPEPEEEEEDSNPLKTIFGSRKKEQADVSPANARKSAVRGAKAAGKAAKQAVPPAARRGRGKAQEEEQPKKKGFLASIGLDSEKYVYEEDD